LSKKITNTHDKFFKSLFSDKDSLIEFVSKTIRPAIVKNLDFSTLKIDNTEYIDKRLSSNFSDLVYNCKYKERQNVKITLLFEHKSSVEKFPHFQLLAYMLRIWELQLKQRLELTPVIPIIFYHGIEKWDNKKFEDYFVHLDKELDRFIPRFDYELIDTSTYSNEELKSLFNNTELQVGLLTMKNIFDEREILDQFVHLGVLINKLLESEKGRDFFESISVYMLNSAKVSANKYMKIMKTISIQAEEQFVSTAQQLRQEGRIDGMRDGMERGMERGRIEGIERGISKIIFKLISKGYSNEKIIETTDLSEDKVEELRELYLLNED
jgi:predicted transposase/invertase (TIGR01784 family)